MFLRKILENCIELGEKIAYRCEDETLSYRQLYERSGALAAWLEKQGTSPVMVYGHKSPMMLVCFLACLRSGRAYLPCDRMMPLSRLIQMKRIADVRCILATEELEEGELCSGADSFVDRALLEKICCESAGHLCKEDPQNTAYILFTSGSTGTPKAVPISVGNIDHFLNWATGIEEINRIQNGMMLNQALFSFDLSVADIYLSLLQKNTLVGITREVQEDLTRLYGEMGQSGCQMIVCTPSFLQFCLCDHKFDEKLLPALSTLFLCGEALSSKVAKKLMNRFPKVSILNFYGPTEATCAVSYAKITPERLTEKSLPIAECEKAAVDITIIDQKGDPVADGEIGEILLCGQSVFSGYLGLDSPNCFIKDGENCYRTGDLGRKVDGLVYFEGRSDHQVKYKGYRIELGEIEAGLEALEMVEQAVVLPLYLKDGLVLRLVAAVLCRRQTTPQEILTAFKATMPHYLVPGAIEIVTSLPINANGKCDRNKLREWILSGRAD